MNNNSEITHWTGAPAVRPPQKRTGRRRVAAAAAGASLLAAGLFGVSAASAADATPSAATPTSAASASTPGSTTAAAGHAHQRHATVREELRIDLRAKTGFGDTAHVVAYGLIHHPKAFAKLPVNLQTDLKALEAAPAAERDADAGKIKDTALNGGYGTALQNEAKAIQTKMAQTPAN